MKIKQVMTHVALAALMFTSLSAHADLTAAQKKVFVERAAFAADSLAGGVNLLAAWLMNYNGLYETRNQLFGGLAVSSACTAVFNQAAVANSFNGLLDSNNEEAATAIAIRKAVLAQGVALACNVFTAATMSGVNYWSNAKTAVDQGSDNNPNTGRKLTASNQDVVNRINWHHGYLNTAVGKYDILINEGRIYEVLLPRWKKCFSLSDSAFQYQALWNPNYARLMCPGNSYPAKNRDDINNSFKASLNNTNNAYVEFKNALVNVKISGTQVYYVLGSPPI